MILEGRYLLASGLIGLAILGCLSLSGQTAPASEQKTPAAREASAIYQERCAYCHAEHGEGSEIGITLNVADLRSTEVQREKDEALRKVIRGGKANMPAVGANFTEETVNELIRLVRSFSTQTKDASQSNSQTNNQ